MTFVIRVLSVAWLIAGAGLAVFSFIGLFEEPVQKYGRFWSLPLLPTVTLAASWGAAALGVGLWQGNSSVALLGRIMTVPLFTLSMWLSVSGGLVLSIQGWELKASLLFLSGVIGLAVSVFNYRVAQRAET